MKISTIIDIPDEKVMMEVVTRWFNRVFENQMSPLTEENILSEIDLTIKDKNITYDEVIDAVGAIDRKVLSNLSKYILSGDVNSILSTIHLILEKGKVVSQLAKDLAGYFRDMAVVKTCKDANAILKYPEDIIKDMTEISMSTSINKILNAFKTLSSLDNEFRYSTNPRSLFELNVLNLTMENQKDLEERVKALEDKIKVLP